LLTISLDYTVIALT